MLEFDPGNVLLKPAQRKQLMTSLRRAIRLGERVGDFALKISLRRIGRVYEVSAAVHDALGDFACRIRTNDWRGGLRLMAAKVSSEVHDHRVRTR